MNDEVTITLTGAQADIVLDALGLYLDFSDGVTGAQRALAERTYTQVNAARKE